MSYLTVEDSIVDRYVSIHDDDSGIAHLLIHSYSAQVAGLALAAALVDDPKLQLFLLSAIDFTVFAIVVVVRPFVNQ